MMDNNHRQLLVKHIVKEHIKNEMIVGLGTGRMAFAFVRELGKNVKSNILKNIRVVCTSVKTASIANKEELDIIDINNLDCRLDILIDGADEVDSNKNMIKGRGYALFREKTLAEVTNKYIILVEDTKIVANLGVGTLPIEIAQFHRNSIITRILELSFFKNNIDEAKIAVDNDGNNIVTDNANSIVLIKPIDRLYNDTDQLLKLNREIKCITGVFETGLFVNLNPTVYTISADMVIKVL